jgi:hypothetical protein
MSKSRNRPIVRKELVTQKKKVSDSAIRGDSATTRKEHSKDARTLTQKKKVSDSAIRGDSATTRKEHSKDARTQTLNEDQQVSEPPSSNYGEPIYKVLAVTSPGRSKRDKILPTDVLNKNDSSRSVLLREKIIDSENL